MCGEHCRMLFCLCTWISVGALCACPEQGWEKRPLSLGPWSALSSVRDVPWLFLFPVGVDGASRGDCPPPPLLLIEEDLFSESKKISSWKISQ